jgi:hypothetical protein
LKPKGLDSGGIYVGGGASLTIYGLKKDQSVSQLKREFERRFLINFDRLDSKGLVIRPFPREIRLFNPSISPAQLGSSFREQIPSLARAIARATKGVRRELLIEKLIY